MGSYGRVHLSKHKKSQAWYAIKKLSKYEIVQNKQFEHVINEKAVMVMCLGHPNLVQVPILFFPPSCAPACRHPTLRCQIHGAFHDARCVYMVLEFAQGGDVFTLLRSKQRCCPLPFPSGVHGAATEHHAQKTRIMSAASASQMALKASNAGFCLRSLCTGRRVACRAVCGLAPQAQKAPATRE